MTVKALADRINSHLKRFEEDPKINRYKDPTPEQELGSGLRPYYGAYAWPSGRFVRVIYISYQGSSVMTKDQAEEYLEKLDAGYVGRHYEALRGE